MAKLIDRLSEKLQTMEADMAQSMSAAIDRDEQWERVSAMAGLDAEGCILPPPVGATISREPVTWWKNTSYGAN